MTTIAVHRRADPRLPSHRSRHQRRTPLGAHGEPAVWLMGLATILCAAMITGLVGLIIVQGVSTFRVRPIDHVVLRSGEQFLGMPVREERYEPAESERTRRGVEAGQPVTRRMYRVGNKELGEQPFRWVDADEIASIDRPKDAVLLERTSWGIWLGVPRAVFVERDVRWPDGSPPPNAESIEERDGARVRVTREVRSTAPDGAIFVRERAYVGEGAPGAWDAFVRLHPRARERAAQAERLRKREVGEINGEMRRGSLELRRAEIDHERARTAGPPLSSGRWIGVVGAAVAFGAGFFWSFRWRGVRRHAIAGPVLRTVLACAAGAGVLGAWLESPWTGRGPDDAGLAAIRERVSLRQASLQEKYDRLLASIHEIETEDLAYRVEFVEPRTGRFAPMSQSAPDEPMAVSQVVRAVRANDLGWWGRARVYASRWGEFLAGTPREANTEGGVFPVIFGTVVMTLLLSAIVVPVGVIAALYLREYATQGVVTSAVRIAVNNLAGVPSIVYGVFGLGFFCYTLGKYLDGGPSHPADRSVWWFVIAGASVVAAGAVALAALARPAPGAAPGRRHGFAAIGGAVLWIGAGAMVVSLLATSPYFAGLHPESAPDPVLGTRGILWASLTLAVLTLPVVIVATEEAIAAVPRSQREGSFGCGASKWQTIRRIVLPGAMPGIMTGMILAMARGAGEVAPLMLVGAVKLAPELPVSTSFPFVHIERSFMHLGFHVFDLGFQSPDSEAARPLVWTTTLLLISVVVLLNLVAVRVRARLRAGLRSAAF